MPTTRRLSLPTPHRIALPRARRPILRRPSLFIPHPVPSPAIGMAVLDVHDRPTGEVGAVSTSFIRIDTAVDSFWLETSMVQTISGGEVGLLCSKKQLKDHAWE